MSGTGGTTKINKETKSQNTADLHLSSPELLVIMEFGVIR